MFEHLQRYFPYEFENNLERIKCVRKDNQNQVYAQSVVSIDSGLCIIVLNLDAPILISQIILGFRAIRSSLSEMGVSCKLIIGDTGSTNHKTRQIYSSLEGETDIEVYFGLEYHFSRNNNWLACKSQLSTILFLNNDCLISESPETIVENYLLIEKSNDIAVIGPVLCFPEGSIQHAGVSLIGLPALRGLPKHDYYRYNYHDIEWRIRETQAVTGACLFIKRKLFLDVGGFDEEFEEESQDIALCMEISRFHPELSILTTNFGPLIHLENGTRKKNSESVKDRSRFIRKYSSFMHARGRL